MLNPKERPEKPQTPPKRAAAPKAPAPKAPAPKMVDAALDYARQGIPVFPLRVRGKEPLISRSDGGQGFYDATTDERQIRAWWKKTPDANIGSPTGEASGFDVLDFDPRHRDERAVNGVVPDRPALPATRAARSGSGGLHCFFQHHDGVRARDALYAGVDLKADGGYVVLAPSVHPSGARYEWLNLDELAPLPAWVVDDRAALSPQEAPDWREVYTGPAPQGRQEDAQKWITDALAKAVSGGSRNRAGFDLACQLLWNGIPDPEAAILEYAARCPEKPGDPYTAREAWRSLASAARYPRREPARSQNPVSFTAKRAERLTQASAHALATQAAHGEEDASAPDATPYQTYELTEFGNMHRLRAMHGANIRYNDAWGFTVWDGRRWLREGAELVVRRWIIDVIAGMKLTAADLARQSAMIDDASESKALALEASALMKWAARSQTDQMVNAVLRLTEPMVVADVNDFDNEPMLFNCANGTIDLHTGELRPHARADMLTQISPVTYDPNARAPRWEQFITEIMCGRADVVAYLQRAFGYSITGETNEQVWHLLIGEGENGKGRLIDAVSLVMGDYAGKLNASSITLGAHKRSGSEASPDMAALKGKRFVKVTETAEGARIDAPRVKELSGEDTLTERHLGKEFFTFLPVLKLWIYTNHEPQTRDTGHAYWRRVRKVPFDFNIREHPGMKDAQLGKKLAAEASGILNWLVAGCLTWQRDGLKAPAIVADATDAMRASQDGLRMFLVDRCQRAAEGVAPAKDLYFAYKAWADEAGERAQTQKIFGRMLKERGFTSFTSMGYVKYRGLYLIDASEVTDATVESWNDTIPTHEPVEDCHDATESSTVEKPENKPTDSGTVDLVDLFPGFDARENSIGMTPEKGHQSSTVYCDSEPKGEASEATSTLTCPSCGGSNIRDYSGDLRCAACDVLIGATSTGGVGGDSPVDHVVIEEAVREATGDKPSGKGATE